MAKMFYTLEEVCEKLGKSEDEVKEMAKSGQIQEFRDRDKLMFKVDQIDLLAGGDEDSDEVTLDLEDTSGGSGLDLKGEDESAIGLADSRESTGLDSGDEGATDAREGTGVSVFDTGHGSASGIDLADSKTDDEGERSGGPSLEEPAAGDTQVGEAVDDDLSLEAVGSGSGLLDLTRESDDTSLGADLLEEVYSSDDNIEIPANASGLFEASGEGQEQQMAEPMGGGGGGVPMVVEAYDGSGSGLGVGMMIGSLVALVCLGIITVVGVSGATPDLAMKMSSSQSTLYIWTGGLLGITIVLGLIGLFIGKASE